VVQCEIGRAVMMGSYKYIRFDEGANDEQLFDLSSDPYEMDNRIDDPALADVRARLRRALSRQVHGIDDRFGQAYVPKV
jgi:arylsulfatase A-like enzyme